MTYILYLSIFALFSRRYQHYFLNIFFFTSAIMFLLVCPKISFTLKIKLKDTIFIFTKNVIKQCTHHFVSLPSAIFQAPSIIPSSQNFLYFWAKNCSRYPLQSSRELKFFPLRKFCKDQNKWTFEGVMSGECGGWIRTSQTVTVFAWSSKKHAVFHYPDGRLCILHWLILDAFYWVVFSVGLNGSILGLITWFSGRSSLLILSCMQHHLPCMKSSLWCGWCGSFYLPHFLFCSTLLYSIHSIPCPSHFVLKMKHFCYISVENHMQKYSQGFFT